MYVIYVNYRKLEIMAEIVHDNEKCLQVESDETVTEIPNVLNRQQIQHGCDPARDGNVLQAMSS